MRKKLVILALLLVIALSIATPLVVFAGNSPSAVLDVQQSYQLTSDTKSYSTLETSGCIVDKGMVRLRFDVFLDPDAPGYDQHHIQVPVYPNPDDPMEGYLGKVDEKTGEPIDWDDYNHWVDGLPKVWQDNPFVCVFVRFDADVTDEEIKARHTEVIEAAYESWVLSHESTRNMGNALCHLTESSKTGSLTPDSLQACDVKLVDIKDRADEFDSRTVNGK